MRTFLISTVLFAALVSTASAAEPAGDLGNSFESRLAKFGHRNWIVIADAAYPAQTAVGIETVVIDRPQLDVVKQVLASVDTAAHVRPLIYVDKEMKFVDEENAKGMSEYRSELAKLLDGKEVTELLHEEIIAKLDETGKTFNVLILKSDMLLPYTSVFIELECGYWSAKSETALRKAMQSE